MDLIDLTVFRYEGFLMDLINAIMEKNSLKFNITLYDGNNNNRYNTALGKTFEILDILHLHTTI